MCESLLDTGTWVEPVKNADAAAVSVSENSSTTSAVIFYEYSLFVNNSGIS